MVKKHKILTMMRRLPQDCVYDKMDSPVGELTLIASTDGLHALLWEADYYAEEFLQIIGQLKQDTKHAILQMAKKQLKQYFNGQRREFDIPLILDGTEFQKSAWRNLIQIPYGQTRSYQQQAAAIGGPEKVRAVGSANGRNPISIVVPCHRVIAKNGNLCGFGGGLGAKEFLLNLERENC